MSFNALGLRKGTCPGVQIATHMPGSARAAANNAAEVFLCARQRAGSDAGSALQPLGDPWIIELSCRSPPSERD